MYDRVSLATLLTECGFGLPRVCKAGEPFIIQVRTTRIGVSSAVARGIFDRLNLKIPESAGGWGDLARGSGSRRHR